MKNIFPHLAFYICYPVYRFVLFSCQWFYSLRSDYSCCVTWREWNVPHSRASAHKCMTEYSHVTHKTSQLFCICIPRKTMRSAGWTHDWTHVMWLLFCEDDNVLLSLHGWCFLVERTWSAVALDASLSPSLTDWLSVQITKPLPRLTRGGRGHSVTDGQSISSVLWTLLDAQLSWM
jgi:hypothetical protein